jgi:C4-dicarboxylate-specific signal transduction histidine kinase
LNEARTAFDLFVLRGELRDAELQIVSREGVRIDVSLNVSAVRDDQGNIAFLRSIWRDITGRRQAEEKIRQQQTDLAHVSRLSMMGEMAAGLAHEINQPLEAIAAYAAGASMRINNGNVNQQRLVQIIDRIAADAQRAGNVIRRLRRFVRKREPQHNALDINLLIQDVVQFMASDALQDEITVELHLRDDLPPARGDSVEIQQVVLNLIRNGFDAMSDVDPGHRALGIETCADGPGAVKVIVRDAGPGVTADSTDQVFEAFFSSKSDGLGMGLAISRSIIESHGGRIWVDSSPGCGAEFHFSLPVADGRMYHV